MRFVRDTKIKNQQDQDREIRRPVSINVHRGNDTVGIVKVVPLGCLWDVTGKSIIKTVWKCVVTVKTQALWSDGLTHTDTCRGKQVLINKCTQKGAAAGCTRTSDMKENTRAEVERRGARQTPTRWTMTLLRKVRSTDPEMTQWKIRRREDRNAESFTRRWDWEIAPSKHIYFWNNQTS